MVQTRNFRRIYRGMTLVELLMVVAIMTILLAVAIPMVRPAFKDRVLREASRQVNTFFAVAKARAAESGRNVGVWIEVSENGSYADRLYTAEVAPSFTGSTQGVTCTVDATGNLKFWTPWPDVDPMYAQKRDDTEQGTFLDLLTPLPNENRFFIRFDHKGPVYACANNGSGDFRIAAAMVPRGTEDPGPTVVTGTPVGSRPVGRTFEIIRGPSKSVASPLTLPGDAVIDLTVSGVGIDSTANGFNTALPGGQVIIMFTPAGQMGAVYVDTTEFVVGASVFLLIGRRAKVISPILPPPSPPAPSPTINTDLDDPELSNLADPVNVWIKVNHRTGAVTTDDSAVAPAMPTVPTVADFQNYIRATREFARGSRQKGGR